MFGSMKLIRAKGKERKKGKYLIFLFGLLKLNENERKGKENEGLVDGYFISTQN